MDPLQTLYELGVYQKHISQVIRQWLKLILPARIRRIRGVTSIQSFFIRHLHSLIDVMRSKLLTKHLYSFSRKTAFDLLTHHGDLRGAIEAFTRLRKVHRPIPEYKRLDNLMVLLLPVVAEMEERLTEEVPRETSANRPPRLVISLVVWGELYLMLFEDYCLPSLRAAGNLSDLGETEVHWHIFTTEADRRHMVESGCQKALEEIGPIRFEAIPEGLIALTKGDNRYWLYGAVSQLSFRFAARLDADVHFMNPDTVYSRNFFRGTLEAAAREGAQIILTNAFRTQLKSVCKALDAAKDDAGRLGLTAGALHRLGLKHVHPASRIFFVTPEQIRDGLLPNVHYLGWRDESTLVIYTPHYQATLVRRDLLSPDMRLSYYTVDSVILRQRFGKRDVNVYVLKAEDEMGYFEISPRKFFMPCLIKRGEFMRTFWNQNGLDEYDLFCRELRLPLDGPEDLEDVLCSQGWDCAREFARLLSELIGNRPNPKTRSQKRLTIMDVKAQTEMVLRLEINHGCGAEEIERLVKDLRLKLTPAYVAYSGSQLENDHLKPMIINCLRLELLRELRLLIHVLKLPIDEAAAAFIEFVWPTYIDCMRRGKEDRTAKPGDDCFVLGSIVWGERYIRNFMEINVRSLLAPGNLPALRDQGPVVHVIVTNEVGREAITRHPVMDRLATTVTAVKFIVVPDNLIQKLMTGGWGKEELYLFYGMLDHCNIHYAKGMGAHLFMIPVDAVVADGSLANMAAYRHQGYECCGGGNIVAEEESFVEAILERFRDDPFISMSSYDLASLAAEHPHHYFRSQVIARENRSFGSHARELYWPTAEGVTIHSVFIHPLFTTASALARYERMHYANVDYGMIPRMFDSPEKIKILDPREVYANNFCSAERLFEVSGKPFSPEVFLHAHGDAFPVQKKCSSRARSTCPASCRAVDSLPRCRRRQRPDFPAVVESDRTGCH